MSTRTKLDRDPIRKSSPDRLHYATGELLGADDFVQEQTYHRRQLAQALLFLHGRGSVAGLEAVLRTDPGPDDLSEVHLLIRPGIAIDGEGRLIEVPRPACLRLRRWFDFIAARKPQTRSATDPAWDVGDLRAAWRADAAGPPGGGLVVADVFLAFHSCDRGYTPAFATGPFDALDASQPSRVRDGYELTMVLRPENPLPPRFDPWAEVEGTPADRITKAREASFKMWDALKLPAADKKEAWKEVPAGTDPSAVLLARVKLPAAPPPADPLLPPGAVWEADSWNDPTKVVDNTVRSFVLPPAAMLRLAAP